MPYRLPPTRAMSFFMTMLDSPLGPARLPQTAGTGRAAGICAHGLSVNGTFYIGVIQVLTIVTVRPPFSARGILCHDFMFGAHPEGPDFVRKARFYHYFRFCTLSYFMTFFLDFFWGYLTFQK